MSDQRRVLFGSVGWPCGIHEIASNINRLNLADVMIYRIGPDELSDEFINCLNDFKPDIVGFRIESGRFETVCRFIEKVREYLKTIIVLGGPTATLHPAEVLKQSGADYVFAGDAEKPFACFLELLQEIPEISISRKDRNFDFRTIPGLTWFSANERIEINPPEAVDEETLRKNELNWSFLYNFSEPLDSIYLTGGRGCPGQCSFCSRLHGRTVRTKPSKQIIEEIRGADRLVQNGKLLLTSWPLYKESPRNDLRPLSVSWCSVFDEDFFLDRKRAAEFLQQYEFYGFQKRYRLGFQTNPRSLLNPNDRPNEEIFYWISRTQAMIQLGAESFHPKLLRRWNKRHTVQQLEAVLDGLDRCGQDYNVFHILTDYDSTVDEVRETTTLLLETAARHPKMRIASTAFMIPLYGTKLQQDLERSGRMNIGHFTDYEQAHPEWMDPEVVRFAEKIDDALQQALYPELREQSLQAVQNILNQSS